jgi:hypothetical protein
MYKEQPEQLMEHLRQASTLLISYTFPLAPIEYEDDIGPLKRMEMTVDGYELVIYFNKADYDDYYLETFQTFSRNSVFLPFNLVVKLARRMLGTNHLSLIEFYQDNRKVYCWSVCVDKEGKAITSPTDDESESSEYEGFEYKRMSPNQINLY